MLKILGAVVVYVSLAGNALAQRDDPLLSWARLAKDLEFPAKPSRLSFSSTPEMALYKPDGRGPFPAVVLHHQCVAWGRIAGKTCRCWNGQSRQSREGTSPS